MYDLYGFTIDLFQNNKTSWHYAGKNDYITISVFETLLFSCYIIPKRWSRTELNEFAKIIKHYLEDHPYA